MKGYFRKIPGGSLVPDDEETAEEINRIKIGRVIHVDFKEPRNYKFHKKYFALLAIGFDVWEPPVIEYKGLPSQKNFDRFRKDVTCSAGYYDVVTNLKGEVRLEAKSISFAKMSEEEFEKLYSATVNVLLQKVLKSYTKDDLERIVSQLISF